MHSSSDIHSNGLIRSDSRRQGNARGSTPTGTFAPQFIKQEDGEARSNSVRNIEGENDFSGKRYVWVKDDEKAFVKACVLEELGEDRLRVQCDGGSVSCRWII